MNDPSGASGSGGQGLSFLSDDPLAPKDLDANDYTHAISAGLFQATARVPEAPANAPHVAPFERDSTLRALLRKNNLELSETALHAAKRRSVTCAVFGSWGSGKTSLLKLLENQYARTGSRTIWFEPWRYEHEENLLIPLMVEMSTAVSRELQADEVKQAAWQTTKKLLGSVTKALARGGSKVLEKKIGLDVYALGEEAFNQYNQVSRDWRDSLSETNQLQRSLQELVTLAASGTENSKSDSAELQYPVAVFIDDLDRCDPAQVRELLESIKLFLHTPGCIFFLALDEEQVQFALSQPYQEIFRKTDGFNVVATTHGHRYLQKFFQHAVHLRRGDSYYESAMLECWAKTWYELLGALTADILDFDERLQELNKPFWYRLRAIFDQIDKNPRLIKRVARWLYLQKQTYGEHFYDNHKLVQRFAETVFAANHDQIWIAELQGSTEQTRINFFNAVSNVLRNSNGTYDGEAICEFLYNMGFTVNLPEDASFNPNERTTDDMVLLVNHFPNFTDYVHQRYTIGDDAWLAGICVLAVFAAEGTDAPNVDKILS